MIATVVTSYWQASQPAINRTQQHALLSNSLQEIEHQANSPTTHKRLSLSARTASTWLHRMGFNWKEVKKGIYKNGHERPDVKQYRQQGFLLTIGALLPRMPYPVKNQICEVVDIKKPELPAGEKLCIPVTHDEFTGNANDGPHH